MDAAPAHQTASSALSYSDLCRRVLAVVGAFGALVVVISLVGFGGLRQDAIEATRQRAQSYSTILSAHLDRTMGAVQGERLGPTGPPEQWASVLERGKGWCDDDQFALRHRLWSKMTCKSVSSRSRACVSAATR